MKDEKIEKSIVWNISIALIADANIILQKEITYDKRNEKNQNKQVV